MITRTDSVLRAVLCFIFFIVFSLLALRLLLCLSCFFALSVRSACRRSLLLFQSFQSPRGAKLQGACIRRRSVAAATLLFSIYSISFLLFTYCKKREEEQRSFPQFSKSRKTCFLFFYSNVVHPGGKKVCSLRIVGYEAR